MTKTLYLECSSGIGGDMAVAALLDLGSPEEKAEREKAVLDVLGSLPVQGFEIRISRVEKSGLDACDFDVVLDAAHENHDHDMDYLYGHLQHDHAQGHGHDGDGDGDRGCDRGCDHHRDSDHLHHHDRDHCHDHHGAHLRHHDHSHDHGHHHDHDHEHAHEHAHDHSHAHSHDHGRPHAHHHEHRNLADVCAIIDASCATEKAKRIARDIFEVVAEAEAKAHGKPVAEVHFHEVGAVDSIADVLAFAVCLDHVAADAVVVIDLAEGKGAVRCQHGIIPVPVPAVVNIVSAHGIALRMLDVFGELVTPTGAAIVAATRTSDKLPERFVIKAVGLGAGKRDYDTPGVVRAMIIE